jgi:hypothetical protein
VIRPKDVVDDTVRLSDINNKLNEAGYTRAWFEAFYAAEKAAKLAQQEANAPPPPYTSPSDPNGVPPYIPPGDPSKSAPSIATGVPPNGITGSLPYVYPPDPERPAVQLATKPNLNPMGL